MRMRSLISAGFLCCMIPLLVPTASDMAHGTSAQIQLTEPVMVPTDGHAHGTAFFGIVAASDVYDSAGSLGATFRMGGAGAGRLYFFGDIFTWIENPNPSEFAPRRLIYTIEPGIAWQRGQETFRLFVKHQSYHDVDSFDNLDESYELYGASYIHPGRLGCSLRVGRYVNRRVVDYAWDIASSATFSLHLLHGRETYAIAWLHHVTESDGPGGRDGFTDYAGELGINYRSGLTLFARYELLHDIDRFDGTSDHHVLVGTKYTW